MLKAGLNYEDVAAVATVLAEIGQEVSVNSVRRHLGTGSRFIIGRHLARWRGEQSAPVTETTAMDEGAETPPPPTASLTHALESLGTAFQVATETQIRPLEERVQLVADELMALRQGLTQEEAATSEQLQGLAADLRAGDRAAAKKIEQIRKRLELSEQRLEALDQRIGDTANAWQAQTAELGARITRMGQEHTALMGELLAKLDGLSSAHTHLMKSLRDHQESGQSQITSLEQRLVSLSDSVIELVPRGEAEKPRKKKE